MAGRRRSVEADIDSLPPLPAAEWNRMSNANVENDQQSPSVSRTLSIEKSDVHRPTGAAGGTLTSRRDSFPNLEQLDAADVFQLFVSDTAVSQYDVILRGLSMTFDGSRFSADSAMHLLKASRIYPPLGAFRLLLWPRHFVLKPTDPGRFNLPYSAARNDDVYSCFTFERHANELVLGITYNDGLASYAVLEFKKPGTCQQFCQQFSEQLGRRTSLDRVRPLSRGLGEIAVALGLENAVLHQCLIRLRDDHLGEHLKTTEKLKKSKSVALNGVGRKLAKFKVTVVGTIRYGGPILCCQADQVVAQMNGERLQRRLVLCEGGVQINYRYSTFGHQEDKPVDDSVKGFQQFTYREIIEAVACTHMSNRLFLRIADFSPANSVRQSIVAGREAGDSHQRNGQLNDLSSAQSVEAYAAALEEERYCDAPVHDHRVIVLEIKMLSDMVQLIDLLSRSQRSPGYRLNGEQIALSVALTQSLCKSMDYWDKANNSGTLKRPAKVISQDTTFIHIKEDDKLNVISAVVQTAHPALEHYI